MIRNPWVNRSICFPGRLDAVGFPVDFWHAARSEFEQEPSCSSTASSHFTLSRPLDIRPPRCEHENVQPPKFSAVFLAYIEPVFSAPGGPPAEMYRQVLDIAALVWNAVLLDGSSGHRLLVRPTFASSALRAEYSHPNDRPRGGPHRPKANRIREPRVAGRKLGAFLPPQW